VSVERMSSFSVDNNSHFLRMCRSTITLHNTTQAIGQFGFSNNMTVLQEEGNVKNPCDVNFMD